MKTSLTLLALAALLAPAGAVAQNDDVAAINIESVSVTEINAKCKTNYTSSWRDNWFMQLGAGIQSPFVENYLPSGKEKHHITALYNIGVGHWMSPYLGLRFSGYYGKMRWDYQRTATAQMANLNFDLMWDMCNSLGGVNAKRPVSVLPFVGLGGTFVWDYDNNVGANDYNYKHERLRKNQWMVPVSAGVQVRFRLCKYVDFFVEGRAVFYGDNFNNTVANEPVDINLNAIGGFNINFGGRQYDSYNPCDYLAYIADLNNQVNALRGDLAVTAAALAEAEAQLPCPEVQQVTNATEVATPLLSAVRFQINSAVVEPEEMVNVYNVAQYMKQNPSTKVVIKGYADKDTGTSTYNMELSRRRAQAVYDILTRNYGIDGSRLTVQANGSDSQPYPDNNDWNRIVIFAR